MLLWLAVSDQGTTFTDSYLLSYSTTAMVESVDPDRLVPVLNGYLDAIVQVAFHHQGTVDSA